jgi:carbon-monoxide dehydrogenase large subunit
MQQVLIRKPHVIGKPFPLIEAQKKLTGMTCYAGDLETLPGMLHARVLFSTRPRARFQLKNLEAARQIPGVVALITGKDHQARMGYTIKDRELLAVEQVAYAGQPLAIVAAETLAIADAALARIEVHYTDLPAVLDIAQALAPDSPAVHPHYQQYPGNDALNARPEQNIAHALTFTRGDTEQAFAQADVILERTYTAAPLQHAPMETHGGMAQAQPDGSITMWMHIQAPFLQRRIIAEALGMRPEQIRIITGCVGGSFGGKIFVSIEALLAAIALHTNGRSVRLLLTREEEFGSVFMAPAMQARIKMAATQTGRLLGIQATYDWNIGASVDASLFHLQAVTLAGTGPYAFPNAEIHTNAIYTNLLPAAPLRGLGIAQIHWAIEQHIAELAEMLYQNPLTMRQWNLIKGGDQLFPNFTMHANGLETCGLQVLNAIKWKPTRPQQSETPAPPALKSDKKVGRGMALSWSPIILSDQCGSSITLRLDKDNLCDIVIDGVDIGQGLYAFATQLVSFEINIPVEWITVQPTDTAKHPAYWQASYHNLMWSTGHALLKATAQMKQEILRFVGALWNEPITGLDIVDGEVISYASRRKLPLMTLLTEGSGDGTPPPVFEIKAMYRPPNIDGAIDSLLQSFATTAYAAEVEVDETTGGVTILQLAAAVDVGHALNPESVKAQIKGGMIQSVSYTLLEEMVFEDGIPQAVNFCDYPIATTADMPRQLHPIVVEVPQRSGPYGARDLSNHVQAGAAPAIANAIYRAVGVRIRDLPITAQRIYDALQAKKKET